MLVHNSVRQWCHRLNPRTNYLGPLCKVDRTTTPSVDLRLLVSFYGINNTPQITTTSKSQERAQRGWVNYTYTTPLQILIHRIGLTREEAQKCISSYQMLRSYESKDILEKISFMEHIGMTNSMMKKAIQKCPKVLGCSIETLRRLVDWFTDLGVSSKKIAYIVMVTGQFVAPYMVDNLSHQRDYLLHEVGLSNYQVGIVLTKHPQLMTHCLDPIKSRIRFLESYNYSKREICKMIQACPEILASSIDTMSAKLIVLGSIFGQEAALSTFCKYPRIIMYNSSALQKSFDFLLDTVNLPVKEIQPLIVMRNVERIILPRFNHLKSLNVPDSYFRRRFWIQSSDTQFISQFPDYIPLPKSQRIPCDHPSSASKSVESDQFSPNTSSSLTTMN